MCFESAVLSARTKRIETGYRSFNPTAKSCFSLSLTPASCAMAHCALDTTLVFSKANKSSPGLRVRAARTIRVLRRARAHASCGATHAGRIDRHVHVRCMGVSRLQTMPVCDDVLDLHCNDDFGPSLLDGLIS